MISGVDGPRTVDCHPVQFAAAGQTAARGKRDRTDGKPIGDIDQAAVLRTQCARARPRRVIQSNGVAVGVGIDRSLIDDADTRRAADVWIESDVAVLTVDGLSPSRWSAVVLAFGTNKAFWPLLLTRK